MCQNVCICNYEVGDLQMLIRRVVPNRTGLKSNTFCGRLSHNMEAERTVFATLGRSQAQKKRVTSGVPELKLKHPALDKKNAFKAR